MPKTKIIIANWKMNLAHDESVMCAQDLRRQTESLNRGSGVELAVCPSFDSIASVRDVLKGSGIALGAQDVFWQDTGAFTGEISASMLKKLGVSFVIIGHSERRLYLKEDDDAVNKKIRAALLQGLTPILCVGETYEERSSGHTDLILMRQVIQGLQGIQLKPQDRLIVAYEPVWVIGTGQAIQPPMAELASRVIQQSLIDVFPLDHAAEKIHIIYGGSVDEGNIGQFMSLPTIEGALVGTTSLHIDKFVKLISSII